MNGTQNDDTHLSLQSSQSGVETDCLLYLWRRRGADLSVLSRLCTSVPPPHFFVVKHTDNFSLDKADHTLSLIFQHFLWKIFSLLVFGEVNSAWSGRVIKIDCKLLHGQIPSLFYHSISSFDFHFLRDVISPS